MRIAQCGSVIERQTNPVRACSNGENAVGRAQIATADLVYALRVIVATEMGAKLRISLDIPT